MTDESTKQQKRNSALASYTKMCSPSPDGRERDAFVIGFEWREVEIAELTETLETEKANAVFFKKKRDAAEAVLVEMARASERVVRNHLKLEKQVEFLEVQLDEKTKAIAAARTDSDAYFQVREQYKAELAKAKVDMVSMVEKAARMAGEAESSTAIYLGGMRLKDAIRQLVHPEICYCRNTTQGSADKPCPKCPHQHWGFCGAVFTPAASEEDPGSPTDDEVESFVCIGCRRRVSVVDGAADDMPDHCSDCWAAARHDGTDPRECSALYFDNGTDAPQKCRLPAGHNANHSKAPIFVPKIEEKCRDCEYGSCPKHMCQHGPGYGCSKCIQSSDTLFTTALARWWATLTPNPDPTNNKSRAAFRTAAILAAKKLVGIKEE